MKLFYSFRQSAAELKDLRSITGAALLLALSILLTYFFRLDFGGQLSIGLSFNATAMMGMMFGPVVTGIANGLGDIIKCIIKPQGPYFFGYTLNAALGGVLYGVFLYHKKPTLLRVAATKATVNLVINAFLNTFWMAMLAGEGFYAMIPVRIVKNIAVLPAEIAILFVVLRATDTALRRAGYYRNRRVSVEKNG